MFRLFMASVLMLSLQSAAMGQSRYGPNDTLLVPVIVYNGDTIPYREMDMVFILSHMTEAQKEAFKQWTRLRNAVYVTYPYAIQAGYTINEVNFYLGRMGSEKERKKYLRSKEADLRKKFADPLMQLSIYQGRVLMKLINRETNNNCFEIIKEYKGGFSARFWQTVAWVFGGNLKLEYDPKGSDAEMERIVREVASMYGRM